MEFGFSSFLLLPSFLLIIFMFHKTRVHLKTTKQTLNLPPGPKKLPFIGNLHHLSSSNLPHRTLTDLAKKYGPLVHLKLGEVDTIIISSPEIAKLIMKTHDVVFASRPSLIATKILCYGNTDLVFAPYGEYWRQLRKICTLELLSAKRVQSFRPIREQEVLDLCKWIALHEGSPIYLTEKVSSTNNDIVVRATLGQRTNAQATYVAILEEAIKFFASVSHIADVYPSIKLIGMITGLKRKIEKLHEKLDKIIGNIIEDRKRKNATKIDEGNKHAEDLLDVLLKIQEDGSLELPLTTDNIKVVLSDMFGGGTETSTTVIDWAMAEMLKNPRVLINAQNEVRNLFDSKQHRVNESYFNELSYLKLVIKETLRMHPPAPLLPRETRENWEINGYQIPAKSRLLVNAWAMGRDPKYWEDPERFEPERFLEKSVDYSGNNLEYIPFGAGRRMCPGISFGLANVELQLAMFLYHFDWVLPNEMKPEDMEMRETGVVTCKRESSLCVIPVVRRSLPLAFGG